MGRPLIVRCPEPVNITPEPGKPTLVKDGQVHAWFATLDALQDRAERYRALLDRSESDRAARFLHDRDRLRYILGHGLLRELLGRYVDAPAKDLELLRGRHGKPYLDGHPVHFNLSDTKDAILIAIGMQPVGADVETMDRRTDHHRVAGHYFTPREVEGIRQAEDGKRRFLELWTRKEAVLKACGVGLMDDLHSLEVGEPENTMTISHPEFVRMAAAQYQVRTVRIGEQHLTSIACEDDFPPLRLFQA